jgi:hypothetical protein
LFVGSYTRKEKPLETSDILVRAQDFIWRNARLLERQMFAYLFEGGSKGAVLSALRAYQNRDGGIGNALEPDNRAAISHPAAIDIAMMVLDKVDGFDDPMVGEVCDFLLTITTPEGGVPFSLPAGNKYPHAPWWEATDNPPPSLNMTAGISGLLLKHGVVHPWLVRATEFCYQATEVGEERDFDTLIRVVTFLRYAPDRDRARALMDKILDRISEPGVVAMDPEAKGYAHKPPDWAPTPDSPCRALFSDDVMATHLQALAAYQQPDGGWPISWEPISPGVEIEWRGWVTIEALEKLSAYGLLKVVPTTGVLSRKDGLRLMSGVYGVSEGGEAAIIDKMLEAADKPFHEED